MFRRTYSNLKARLCTTAAMLVLSVGVVSAAAAAEPDFMANVAKHKPPFKIGVSNGYIGNTWRAQFVSDIEKVAGELKGQGDIASVTVLEQHLRGERADQPDQLPDQQRRRRAGHQPGIERGHEASDRPCSRGRHPGGHRRQSARGSGRALRDARSERVRHRPCRMDGRAAQGQGQHRVDRRHRGRDRQRTAGAGTRQGAQELPGHQAAGLGAGRLGPGEGARGDGLLPHRLSEY